MGENIFFYSASLLSRATGISSTRLQFRDSGRFEVAEREEDRLSTSGDCSEVQLDALGEGGKRVLSP